MCCTKRIVLVWFVKLQSYKVKDGLCSPDLVLLVYGWHLSLSSSITSASVCIQCLIIGAGPCGLRTAIELAFLGAKVVLLEKRDAFSRNNVLHLWPFTIQDLRGLGAKKFYGKFCAGAIDHISEYRKWFDVLYAFGRRTFVVLIAIHMIFPPLLFHCRYPSASAHAAQNGSPAGHWDPCQCRVQGSYRAPGRSRNGK